MKGKQLFAVIMIIIGAFMLIFSNYIADQISEGKIRIRRGEKLVQTSDTLFSSNPLSKEIGKTLTSPAEKKIAKGKEEVDQYEQIVSYLRIGGAVLIVLGFFVLFTRKSKKR